MKMSNKVLLVAFIVLASAFVIFGGILAAFYFSMTTTVMKKVSPDKRHTAKLIRHDGIDVMYKVYVDGHRVFWSPDFAPVAVDFREQIAWDKSGQIVVLEVAGERLFGYHSGENRALTDEEILAVEFAPFEELRYEGESPREVSEE